MEVITRKQAREQKLSRYYTGKPCVHGHLSERWTCSGVCIACRMPYLIEYRQTHQVSPEYTKQYREKNKTHLQQYMKEYMRNYRAKKKAEGNPLP